MDRTLYPLHWRSPRISTSPSTHTPQTLGIDTLVPPPVDPSPLAAVSLVPIEVRTIGQGHHAGDDRLFIHLELGMV
jgi:hypothetical protein